MEQILNLSLIHIQMCIRDSPNPDPEVTPKPDEDTSNDIDPKNYTADLKKIFPFCIPFDLVHLIQAFEAEPEAPVFEFPFDLELENPWTGKKILDYHHVFKLDMSDYEPCLLYTSPD